MTPPLPRIGLAKASAVARVGVTRRVFRQYDGGMEEKLKFLESLRTFVQIEGAANLDDAVKSIGMSKGTIRTNLQRLNKMFEPDVIDRGVVKTPAGERISAEAKRSLEELEAGLDTARTRLKRLAYPRFPVQLAMSSTIWMWGVEAKLLPLTHSLSSPNAVELLVANSERVERAVAEGWFELGVTARHPTRGLHRKLAHEQFCSDEIVLAVPPGHRWFDAKEVEADDLSDTPVITLDTTANARLVVDEAMEQGGLELAEPHEEVAMAVMAFEEVIDSGVPALVSALAFESPQGRLAAEQGIERRRVAGVDFSREFLLVYENRLRDEACAVKDVLGGLMAG